MAWYSDLINDLVITVVEDNKTFHVSKNGTKLL